MENRIHDSNLEGVMWKQGDDFAITRLTVSFCYAARLPKSCKFIESLRAGRGGLARHEHAKVVPPIKKAVKSSRQKHPSSAAADECGEMKQGKPSGLARQSLRTYANL